MAKKKKDILEVTDLEKRDKGGKFMKGNKFAATKGQWKKSLIAAAKAEITPYKTRQVLKVLFDKAKKGEQWAVKEWLQRGLGDASVAVNASKTDNVVNITFAPNPSPKLVDAEIIETETINKED